MAISTYTQNFAHNFRVPLPSETLPWPFTSPCSNCIYYWMRQKAYTYSICTYNLLLIEAALEFGNSQLGDLVTETKRKVMCYILIDLWLSKVRFRTMVLIWNQTFCFSFFNYPAITKNVDLCLYLQNGNIFFPLEMSNLDVVISSCSSCEDENACTCNQHTTPSEKLLLEDQMRRKLKFFFMNPCEKFWARGRKPWKLSIQILKIVMVTIQVSISDGEFSEVLFY